VVKTSDCEKGYSYTITQITRRIPLEGMTLKEFLELIGKRGRLITCMVLAAPFLIPISIPGTGIVVGFIILIISLSIMLNKYYLVPDKLLNREMSYTNLVKVLNACIRILSFLEKYMKPRLKIMINKKFSSISNNIFQVISSFLFIIPLPIPLTDTLPALGIFFLSARILECDGYLILSGYVVVVITAIYFILVTLLGLKIIFGLTTF
jgi:hypothetical protein